MHPDKAPEPDGHNSYFFQKNWGLVGEDVCRAVLYFFTSGKLLHKVNHTFVTLVPKSTNAAHLNDFRPISCCNTLYKIISKVMANRLQQVIGEHISPNQSAYLKGRMISDTTLLDHEMDRDFINQIGSRLCLEVDLQKVFDTVNGEFVYYMFHYTGFAHGWIN